MKTGKMKSSSPSSAQKKKERLVRKRKGKSVSVKKEKREKRESSPELSIDDDPSNDETASPSEPSVLKYVEKLSQGLGLSTPPSPVSTPKGAKKRKSQKKDSDSSGEEERWLDAIQSGKLEEVDDELKKVKLKDPKLMTARQRAMFERKTDRDQPEQLMSLPSGYKEVVMTAEAIERKALKIQQRKEKADEKRENDKKKTMERLLKKQESKPARGVVKRNPRKTCPVISYLIKDDDSKISLPPGVSFPMEASKPAIIPQTVYCSGPKCKNQKKYSCSKTNVPLCSLECYRKVNGIVA